MSNEITVSLGGQEYQIHPPPYNAARRWREQMRAPLDRLLGAVSAARSTLGALSFSDTAETTNTQALIEALKGVDIGQVLHLLGTVVPELSRAPDLAWDLLMAWSPVLAAEHETIGETATDDEVMTAFVAVVRQAFPLGALTQFLGPSKATTPSSSPVPRGKQREKLTSSSSLS